MSTADDAVQFADVEDDSGDTGDFEGGETEFDQFDGDEYAGETEGIDPGGDEAGDEDKFNFFHGGKADIAPGDSLRGPGDFFHGGKADIAPGDSLHGDEGAGAYWDYGEPNPWGNLPGGGQPEGEEFFARGYDPNWDPGEGGEAYSPGVGADYEPPGWDDAGADGEQGGGFAAPSWDDTEPQSQEEGGDYEEEQADDPQESVPGPPPATPPRRPAPRKPPSRAKRIYHAARRAHGFARRLSPSHYLASKAGIPLMGIGPDPCGEVGGDATFDVYKTGKGWSGVVRIPTEPGRALLMASTPSASPTKAADKALNLTRLAASTPQLTALASPQAMLALKAAQHPAARAIFRGAVARSGRGHF